MIHLYPQTTPTEPTTCRGSWLYLPQSGKEKIVATGKVREIDQGPGSPLIYEWVQEEPPADYVGPLPYCSSVRIASRRRLHA